MLQDYEIVSIRHRVVLCFSSRAFASLCCVAFFAPKKTALVLRSLRPGVRSDIRSRDRDPDLQAKAEIS